MQERASRNAGAGRGARAGSQPAADAVREASEALLRLAREGLTAPLDDLSVIEAELRQLCAARGILAAWASEVWARDCRNAQPAQLVRAWSDAVRQVLVLLKARRDAAGADGLGAGPLGPEEEAWRIVEALPGPRAVAGQCERLSGAGEGDDGRGD